MATAIENETAVVADLAARVARLEERVAELTRAAQPVEHASTREWLESLATPGFRDPRYEEIIRLGREARAAEYPDDVD